MVDLAEGNASQPDASHAAAPSASVAQSAANQNSTGWFYLDAQGSHVGPFTTEQLAAYHTSGYVPRETYVWAQGRAEWQPLHAVPELAVASGSAAAGAAPAAGAAAREAGNAVDSAGGAAAQQAAAAKPAGSRATAAAAPAVVSAAAAKHDDPMAAFTAEISAIEAENEAAEQPPSPAEKSFVDDDGTAYQWDPVARRFVEWGTAGDGAAAPGPQYDETDMTFAGVDEAIPAIPEEMKAARGEDDDAAAPGSKRKQPDQGKLEEAVEREKAKKLKAQEDAKEKAKWFQLQKNSSVYVSGLPLDAKEAELVRVFTKCGVIKLDDEAKPRVKVYRDEDGTGKGDGLVTYLKPPSVDLAVQILDGTALRDGDSQLMSVSQAKFEQKGDFVAKKRAPKKRKKKLLVNQEEQELGWGGFDDVAPALKTTVVLKHMFTLEEFETDAALRGQLQDDVAVEAGKFGPVEKVKVYHTNPEGVVTIKFHDQDSAEQCITVMEGRFFGGRQISASMWDGIQQFHVKPVKTAAKETEEEQQARLERFAAEIEAQEAPDLEPPVPLTEDA